MPKNIGTLQELWKKPADFVGTVFQKYPTKEPAKFLSLFELTLK